jgi:cell division protein FtsL
MFRSSAVVFAVVCMSIGVILFKVKYEVVGLETQHQKIKKSIHEAKESIHILKAEWAHLANPERIQKLSIKYLPEGKLLIDQRNRDKSKQSILKKDLKMQKDAIAKTRPIKDAIDIMLDDNAPVPKIALSKGEIR